MSDVPEYALSRFRHGSAKPRVASTYRVASGWENVVGKPLFTQNVAARLFVDGVTLVRLRWHREEHEVPVHAYSTRRDSR